MVRIRVVNDIVNMVVDATLELYPDTEAEIYFGTVEEERHAKGITNFPTDGSTPVIVVNLDVPLRYVPEILAHELAHAVAGKDAEHNTEWENVFENIHKKFMEMVNNTFESEGFSEVPKKDVGKIVWDDDGYPTEGSLKGLERALDNKDLSLAKEAFYKALKENFYPDACGLTIAHIRGSEKEVWEYHTFGWSGNESIIGVLKRCFLWNLFLERYDSGGHYYFKKE